MSRTRRATVRGYDGQVAGVPPSVEELLPTTFLEFGMATHRGFDSLAVAIVAGVGRDTVLARLGRVMANCVSCHAQYRLVAIEGTPPH